MESKTQSPGGGLSFLNSREFVFAIGRLVPVFAACACLAVSCEYKQPVQFPVRGEPEVPLYGFSREAVEGRWVPSAGRRLSFGFEKKRAIPEDCSLELEYVFPENAAAVPVVLEWGDVSWVLPGDLSFLAPGETGRVIRYAVPVPAGEMGGFSIAAAPGEKRGPEPEPPGQFELRALAFVPRWYGFIGGVPGEGPALTPFVYREAGGGLVIDPPPPYRAAGRVEAAGRGDSPGALTLFAGERRFEGRRGPPPEAPGGGVPGIFIPAGALPGEPYPLILRGEGGLLSFVLVPAADRAFPTEPVPADPGIVLAYPRENWRDPRYEIFRWDRFPGILIFDTADYAVQDRLFKRLAFFVEKAGFRGRLAEDREIAALHGWNAHDYRGEDLGAFFEAARRSGFPLLPEERELEGILLAQGILRRGGGGEIRGGEGAVLSVSRQSDDNLRSLFMAHEGFHGIFFVDGEFREWSRRRWEQLSAGARRFILSYFDYQAYDIRDGGLMVNEFMAHCLQQPVSRASRYFGETLAGRIAAVPWRRSALPLGDGPWWPEIAEAFEAEAAAFSAYVEARWGLAAGRVWRVIPR